MVCLLLLLALLAAASVIDVRTRLVPWWVPAGVVVLWCVAQGAQFVLGDQAMQFAQVAEGAQDVSCAQGFQVASGIRFSQDAKDILFIQFAQLFCIEGLPSLIESLVAAVAVGGGLLVLTFAVEHAVGHETFGGGDIKLLAALALFLGLEQTLVCLFVACVVAVLWAAVSRRRDFPFIPAITVGYVFVLVVV